MKGWGPRSLVCPSNSKPRETKLFGRLSRDFAAEKSKGLRKKVRVQFSFPKKPQKVKLAI